MTRAWTLFVLLWSIAALSPTVGRSQTGVDYSAPSSWLCLPGRSDACSAPLTSTVVSPANGALSKRVYGPDPTAPIDCFYVYPTVSQEPAANADMTPGPEEQHVAAEQLARFGARCRTFAPLYRQTTIAAMRGAVQGADHELAYGDVLAAWRYYLAHDNHGRGVVLIGHSQGAHLLVRLIAEEIDGKPARAVWSRPSSQARTSRFLWGRTSAAAFDMSRCAAGPIRLAASSPIPPIWPPIRPARMPISARRRATGGPTPA